MLKTILITITIILIILAIAFLPSLAGNETQINDRNTTVASFCGFSTEGSCEADADCFSGGCSGQVCQSKNEEAVITTCEYLECYSANEYKVSCGCTNNKCQWFK